jgi:hypothetical protein
MFGMSQFDTPACRWNWTLEPKACVPFSVRNQTKPKNLIKAQGTAKVFIIVKVFIVFCRGDRPTLRCDGAPVFQGFLRHGVLNDFLRHGVLNDFLRHGVLRHGVLVCILKPTSRGRILQKCHISLPGPILPTRSMWKFWAQKRFRNGRVTPQ